MIATRLFAGLFRRTTLILRYLLLALAIAYTTSCVVGAGFCVAAFVRGGAPGVKDRLMRILTNPISNPYPNPTWSQIGVALGCASAFALFLWALNLPFLMALRCGFRMCQRVCIVPLGPKPAVPDGAVEGEDSSQIGMMGRGQRERSRGVETASALNSTPCTPARYTVDQQEPLTHKRGRSKGSPFPPTPIS
jgi:hypothetical protein